MNFSVNNRVICAMQFSAVAVNGHNDCVFKKETFMHLIPVREKTFPAVPLPLIMEFNDRTTKIR